MTDDGRAIEPEIVTDDEPRNQDSEKQLVRTSMKPNVLFLIPITGRPHLPAQVQPLIVNRTKWEQTLRKASEASNNFLGLAYIDTIESEDIKPEDFPKVGCVIKMLNVVEADDRIQFVAQGIRTGER